jgi:hypothetical protein
MVNYEKDTRQKIIEAGEKAIEQLIKIAEEEVDIGFFRDMSENEFDATALKNYTSTKKLAIVDAFEILSKITTERESLVDGASNNGSKGKFIGVEGRAK